MAIKHVTIKTNYKFDKLKGLESDIDELVKIHAEEMVRIVKAKFSARVESRTGKTLRSFQFRKDKKGYVVFSDWFVARLLETGTRKGVSAKRFFFSNVPIIRTMLRRNIRRLLRRRLTHGHA